MITDNLEEIFDIVNENDQVIGQAKRSEVHKNRNLIHRSIGVVVFNGNGEVFLQQRSAGKDTDPFKWTISCSGHVNKGSTYEESAHRELTEELGVDLPLIPVTKYIYSDSVETEMAFIYKAFSEGPFNLNKAEILTGKFFSHERLIRDVEVGKIILSCSGKEALGKLGWF